MAVADRKGLIQAVADRGGLVRAVADRPCFTARASHYSRCRQGPRATPSAAQVDTGTMARNAGLGGGYAVAKLVLDKLGGNLKGQSGQSGLAVELVRGVLGGVNLVSGWASAFHATLALNGAAKLQGECARDAFFGPIKRRRVCGNILKTIAA